MANENVAVKKKSTRFLNDLKTELKKVIWPTKPQLINNTITVVIACLIVGIVIWSFDFVLQGLYNIAFASR